MIRIAIADLLRGGLRILDRVDPAIRLTPKSVPPPAQLLCVYRSRNWANVAALVGQCRAVGWPVLLHALDQAHPSLIDWTLSTGAGGRFENVNRLAGSADPARWTVVTDDDVVLPHGGLGELVQVCRATGLDIAQPAHRADSFYNYRYTRRRPGLMVRVTGFVEIGPMVVFSPVAWPVVSPFPEEGMGWGTELEWHGLRDRGLKLGIVDCVPLVHLAKPGRGYDAQAETDTLERLLRQRGFTRLEDLQQTERTLPFWRSGGLSASSAGAT